MPTVSRQRQQEERVRWKRWLAWFSSSSKTGGQLQSANSELGHRHLGEYTPEKCATRSAGGILLVCSSEFLPWTFTWQSLAQRPAGCHQGQALATHVARSSGQPPVNIACSQQIKLRLEFCIELIDVANIAVVRKSPIASGEPSSPVCCRMPKPTVSRCTYGWSAMRKGVSNPSMSVKNFSARRGCRHAALLAGGSHSCQFSTYRRCGIPVVSCSDSQFRAATRTAASSPKPESQCTFASRRNQVS